MEGNNIKQNVTEVEDELHVLHQEVRNYKKEVETVRAELVQMENKISLCIEDTPRSLSPRIEELLLDLKQESQKQKDINEHLQKQITSLKKETSTIQQHIIASNTRSQILEEAVGL